MYRILFTRRAVKDFEKLNEDIKLRLKEKFNLLLNNPIGISKKLSSPLIGSYRLRIGDYRVIFDIDDDKVVILRIGHRKDIYK
ncbi:MAG TPA: type II toxin-antitoxin system RelE/ParE family toxin [Ignavibacteriaceae bacterium]|nr:type II toxin-antitoxin system RelE/ParE family toxin [Ignavibacteriaceae bacterium]